MDNPTPPRPFLAQHEFFLRRLHSITGLVPIGAFMTVHLLTNASLLDGPASYQRAVYQIHSLGAALPVIEWLFIFGPILFHGLLGIFIVYSGATNVWQYRFVNNLRYSIQRLTGLIAFLFVVWHVFHLHGWFHFDFWLQTIAEPLGGAQFRPYNAPSTLGAVMQNGVVPVLYAVGVLCCVFHLANGIWTMGITWGLWITPGAQRRANWLAAAVGGVLAVVGMGALAGARSVDGLEARTVEDAMYEARIKSQEIRADAHMRAEDHDHRDMEPE